MKNKLSELEDQLQGIIESNKQIKAISTVLDENWDDLLNINRNDKNGQTTHYEVNRISEKNETLFYMLSLLVKDSEEKNAKVLDNIKKLGREIV